MPVTFTNGPAPAVPGALLALMLGMAPVQADLISPAELAPTKASPPRRDRPPWRLLRRPESTAAPTR